MRYFKEGAEIFQGFALEGARILRVVYRLPENNDCHTAYATLSLLKAKVWAGFLVINQFVKFNIKELKWFRDENVLVCVVDL